MIPRHLFSSGLFALGLLGLTGCAPPDNAVLEQGSSDPAALHRLVPQEGTVYRIRNIKAPGKPVFLFNDEIGAATCLKAIQSNGDMKTGCAPYIVAQVDDGDRATTLHCHRHNIAICLVRTIDGHEPGSQGAILWDWLEKLPEKRS